MAENSHGGGAPLRSIACGSHRLLMDALERDDCCLETGRYLISLRDGMLDEGIAALKACQLKIADARDFDAQAVNLEDAGDAEAMIFPQLGVVLIGGDALERRGMSIHDDAFKRPAIELIEPEYFAFAESSEYLRGFLSAANAIARDLADVGSEYRDDEPPAVRDITWGLSRCKAARSRFSGAGIKIAVLDSGMDVKHPDFAGRVIESRSFVGEPVQDMNGHGTHCIGTATGPRKAAGKWPGYGVAFEAEIHVGKVLTDAGSSTGASVLAGMNWALANRCEVISMSLGSQSPVQMAYTKAGAAALEKGCLMIAASGNENAPTGAPANSPTIFSVGSLDPSLTRSNFSNVGKVDIAAPGRDVFSAWPRPINHKTISGTSMATPHVAGCAALWAQSDASLRGPALWQRLVDSAQALPLSQEQVGAGLVQAP
ncbi:S8 family serine peptidase [Halomonas sp. HNIBRBA4712]|uniref:S8 family serine peptidase n=1 Tax=Halomonas sp. HNIBRBA4712 TaxID=3373087 RepID=UPI003745CE98